ncbi:MAG: DUF4143 domain-containing protein [Betaproteobacteria bacterium]|nr:DUF4143 domain-containing protein [Betaproteobacteria bacterium]
MRCGRAPEALSSADQLRTNYAYMIRRLQPYPANVQERLTKSPKLYLRDSGVLHFLAGLRRPSDLATWSRRWASFEGQVIEELAGLAASRLVRPEFHFWRTHTGAEVDLLIADGRRILPIEIKTAAAVDRHSIAGLRQCMADLGLRRGGVVTTARERRRFSADIEIIPWEEIAAGEVRLF